MKKVLIMASFAVFVLASCKKDYTCTCKVNGVSTGSSTTIKDTKKNAESRCNEGDNTTTAFGVTVTTECSI